MSEPDEVVVVVRIRRTWQRTPWQKIRRAGLAGTGCRLSPEGCSRLSVDDAIDAVAEHDDEDEREWRAALVRKDK